MSDTVRPGRHTVTPRLITPDVPGLAAFLRTVFGAEGAMPEGAPTDLRIGDSIVMVSDGGGVRAAMPGFLHVYVADADATFRAALAAGAAAIKAPEDMPWGDRRATFRDAWGNVWQVATWLGLDG